MLAIDEEEATQPWFETDFHAKNVAIKERSNKTYAHYVAYIGADPELIEGLASEYMVELAALYAFFNDYHRHNCDEPSKNNRLCASCLRLFAVNAEALLHGALNQIFQRLEANESESGWDTIGEEDMEYQFRDDEFIEVLQKDIGDESKQPLRVPSEEKAPVSQTDKQPSPSPPPQKESSSSLSTTKERSTSPTASFKENPPSLVLTHIADFHLLAVERSYFEKTWNSWIEFVFAGHEIPEKFLFGNIDTITPFGDGNVTISFKERPKKRLLDFFTQRLKGNRSCRIKVFSPTYQSRQREENLFLSFKQEQQQRSPLTRTPTRKHSKSSSSRRFTPQSYPTPTTINFNSPQTFTQSPFGHQSNVSTSLYPSFNNNQSSFTTGQSQFVSQEQLLQIQRQLDFLTLHLIRSQSWDARTPIK